MIYNIQSHTAVAAKSAQNFYVIRIKRKMRNNIL